jgi:hypothetical protein
LQPFAMIEGIETYEPATALTGAEDGFEFFRIGRLVSDLGESLLDGSCLGLESGNDGFEGPIRDMLAMFNCYGPDHQTP